MDCKHGRKLKFQIRAFSLLLLVMIRWPSITKSFHNSTAVFIIVDGVSASSWLSVFSNLLGMKPRPLSMKKTREKLAFQLNVFPLHPSSCCHANKLTDKNWLDSRQIEKTAALNTAAMLDSNHSFRINVCHFFPQETYRAHSEKIATLATFFLANLSSCKQ